MLTIGFVLLVFPAGHARHFFGNHLHNGGAFSCREIENGKFLPHTVPKVDAMRGLFVCDVSFSDAAKIGDVPLSGFAIDADILDENCTPMYFTALAPPCVLVEFSRSPLNMHCEGRVSELLNQPFDISQWPAAVPVKGLFWIVIPAPCLV